MGAVEILGLVTQYGVTGLLAVMFVLERTDRKSAEAENAKLTREMVAHITEQKLLSANMLALLGKHSP